MMECQAMRIVAEPGLVLGDRAGGAVAQLGEHLLCKQGVSGSIPLSSTNSLWCRDERQTYPLKKIKVCITSMKCCLFCKNREEKIDLEASRYGFMTHVRSRFR